MKLINSNNIFKLVFFLIWSFFILRISFPINFEVHNFQFTWSKLIYILADVGSIFIVFFIFIYFVISIFKKRQISAISFLIAYPIFALVGYHLNPYQNHFQDLIKAHHFITLTSVILYFSFINSNKIFNFKFKELLIKIILAFFIIYTLVIIFPDILGKFNTYENIRFSYSQYFSLFNNNFYLEQNVNGQTKFLFILLVILFILFRKFLFKNRKISHLFFFMGIFLLVLIYLMQSRFNILASFIFLFFLIFTIKNLSLKKKLLYFLVITIIPVLSFNIYTDSVSRVVSKATSNYVPFNSLQAGDKKDEVLKINIAHNEGNFFTDNAHLQELKENNLIAFKYCDGKGNINDQSNPNGSLENIAGIYNSKKNILGMMPHPERMIDKLISNTDGVNLFSSLLN